MSCMCMSEVPPAAAGRAELPSRGRPRLCVRMGVGMGMRSQRQRRLRRERQAQQPWQSLRREEHAKRGRRMAYKTTFNVLWTPY